MYIHQRSNWPNFTWNLAQIFEQLEQVRLHQGRLIGGMESIGFHSQGEAILQSLTQDILKSSEIEGEILDHSLVRSSVARHLRMDVAGLNQLDRNVEGVVDMILDATQNFDQPLTKQRLFNWHSSLFPTIATRLTKIHSGAWRTGPVYVVSGQRGNEIVHFEAPPAEKADREIEEFLHWVNEPLPIDPVLKAAIAHLWFVTIHPFEDGNGRIGRAIADLLLAKSENTSKRFYSLSTQIQIERKGYYDILEKTQKGPLDITPWIRWFFHCLQSAIDTSLATLDKKINKTQTWEKLAELTINERQKKMINQLLDGFEGKLTSSKWAKITKCSQDTAHRDIIDLVEKGILSKDLAGGRSTSYSLIPRPLHK